MVALRNVYGDQILSGLLVHPIRSHVTIICGDISYNVHKNNKLIQRMIFKKLPGARYRKFIDDLKTMYSIVLFKLNNS
jgi:hypothetical protein